MDKKASYMINKLHNAYGLMSGIDLTYVSNYNFLFQKDIIYFSKYTIWKIRTIFSVDYCGLNLVPNPN